MDSHDSSDPLYGRTSPSGYLGGTFDPLTFCLDIHGDVELSGDEIPALLANNGALFHEVVHSWQLFASTSGFLTGSIRPLQVEFVSQFLKGNANNLKKPLVTHFEARHAPADDSKYVTASIRYNKDSRSTQAIFVVHKYYFDFEKLNAALDDPVRFGRNEDQFVLEAFPPNPVYRTGFEAALIELAAIIREDTAVQLHPLQWPGRRDLLPLTKRAIQGDFNPSREWLRSELGLSQIQEAHARFLEIQLMGTRDYKNNSLQYFRNAGLLGGRYVKPFDQFLALTGMKAPAEVLDWSVHLFILVCEYALNPTVPYVDGYELEFLFDEFHPGRRFRSACDTVARSPGLRAGGWSGGRVDQRALRLAYDIIEDETKAKWAPSLNVAFEQVAKFGEACFASSEFTPIRPFASLLSRHLATILLRTTNPGSDLNPLTILLDLPSAATMMLPPMITANESALFVDSPGLKGPSGTGMISFLIGMVYSDIVAQLLSKRGPFVFDYPMIPDDYKAPIIEAVQKIFETDFGVPFNRIEHDR